MKLNGNIFYFTKYEITINMSEEEVLLPYTKKKYKNFRMEIFYEFYKRYIFKYIDEDVTRFSIFVRLFNYYLYKELMFFNKSWMPLDKSERKVYEGEIRKLEKGVRELNEEIKHLQQEMKLKTENNK